MKVIFLDIDGVLNNHSWLKEQRNFKTFCPDNIRMLNHIVYKTDAKIVISSNWRLYPYDFPAMFKAQHIDGEIIGQTPSINQIENGIYRAVIRGAEIMAYLNDHPEVEKFVILDDDNDMGAIAPRLIRTDPAKGLTLVDASRAIGMLGEKPPLTEEEAIEMFKPHPTPRTYA